MDTSVQLFDITLLATVGLIFAATLVGAYVRSSRRDVCLKCFEGFHVTLERANGKIVWGVMELEASGLELRYRDSVQDANHVESCYVLYSPEYAGVQAIFRYVDDLSDRDKLRRQKDLQKSFHPGLVVRFLRSIQHFFSVASESLTEVLGVIMGSLRKPAGRYITETGETHLKELGGSVISHVGRAYDPLLERFIGQKVVVEMMEGEEVHEHVGIFKAYSSDFIALLDVQFPQKQALTIAQQRAIESRAYSAKVENGILKVHNPTKQTLLLQSLKIGGSEELLNVVVDAGETVELHPEEEFAQAELHVRVVRELDMVVPRTRCMVRHRAERYEPELLPEIIFDLGVMLTGNSLTDAREKRLRKRLRANPRSAMAASNLGAILVQKQNFAEAQEWLNKAYGLRFSLPDNGRRTQMLLNELRRRQAKAPEMAGQLVAGQTTNSVNGNNDNRGG